MPTNTTANYVFLFAIIKRQRVTGEYRRAPDGGLIPINRDKMWDSSMSTAYYERVSDGRVLETSEFTSDLNERAVLEAAR